MLPVHHLPRLGRTHGPDLPAQKSRSTFNWPISWYMGATRAASFLTFWCLPLPKTPEAPSSRGFFLSLGLTGLPCPSMIQPRNLTEK